MSVMTDQIKNIARELGFDPVGIASADPPQHWAFYQSWLAMGYAGEMGYLGRNLDRRSDVRRILPSAKSILCVGLNYLPETDGQETGGHPTGQIARYARGDDYHDAMRDRLFDLLAEIQRIEPSAEGRVYVDTGPVLERDYAERAGVGWFGKHTCLIDKGRGSWFFLGEIILNLDLDCDRPQLDHCGTCTQCLDACPTDAIVEPYAVDSRRCISYLTIELKGAVPRPLRSKMGNWVFGCDICQDVCPWNRKHAEPTPEDAFQARPGLNAPDLVDLLHLDQAAFSKRFKNSPIKRAKRRGLLRNAVIALGNVGGQAEVPALASALKDGEPLVRQHAAWALGKIGGDHARQVLVDALNCECDGEVAEEMRLALEAIDQRGNERERATRY